MKLRNLSILILLGLVASSCDVPRYNFDKGIIPLEVTNFSDVNSSYDDYNSALVISWASDAFSYVFSTNRYSNGADFDFAYYDCIIESGLVNASFRIWASEGQIPLADSVNSTANEYGPYLTFDGHHHYNYPIPDSILNDDHCLYYSSDRNGSQDLFYIYYRIDDYRFETVDSIRELSALNSGSQDAYLCLHALSSSGTETAYFSSNRNGQFDIFQAIGEESKRIEESSIVDIKKNTLLSSDGDDNCPYIKNNMMVFTSNRPGGFGGYDLYYSIYNGDSWSEPVNFGEDINTKYDEFRPVIFDTYDETFINDMLFFSSNRPGGQGGYDLYYTGMKPAAYY